MLTIALLSYLSGELTGPTSVGRAAWVVLASFVGFLLYRLQLMLLPAIHDSAVNIPLDMGLFAVVGRNLIAYLNAYRADTTRVWQLAYVAAATLFVITVLRKRAVRLGPALGGLALFLTAGVLASGYFALLSTSQFLTDQPRFRMGGPALLVMMSIIAAAGTFDKAWVTVAARAAVLRWHGYCSRSQ